MSPKFDPKAFIQDEEPAGLDRLPGVLRKDAAQPRANEAPAPAAVHRSDQASGVASDQAADQANRPLRRRRTNSSAAMDRVTIRAPAHAVETFYRLADTRFPNKPIGTAFEAMMKALDDWYSRK